MRRSFHIGIAGAGMAGLTAALALARGRCEVTVFEAAPRLEEVGAGLQISPNAWRVLAELGLAEALVPLTVAPEGIRIRSARQGATLARMPLGAVAEARWGAPYRVAHRADLQAILAEAAVAAGVDLRLGARVSGVAWDDARARLTLEYGEAAEFDGLVGADGLRSAVRAAMLGDAPPRHSGKVAWRATIPGEALPGELSPEETGLWLGRDAHLVHYALRGGREINVIAVVTSSWQGPGWSAEGDPREIAEAFADWPALARALISAPRGWRLWALADRAPDASWGRGPVTLAGDAAHPMLPFMAQGAAMGIEDGWVLAASLTGSDSAAEGFRRYEARRMARTARVQRAARSNGDIYHLGGLAARGRDLALSLMGTDQLLSRWDWIYAWRPGGA